MDDAVRSKIDALTQNVEPGSPEQAVGQVIIRICEASPAAGEALVRTDKTLADCYKAMADIARKKKRTGNCVVIGPEEAARVIAEYFGLPVAGEVEPPVSPAPPRARKQPKILSLEDFI